MSSEKNMRKRVLRILKPLHAVAIENGCALGTPDINGVDFWIELKSMPAWPARPETALRIDHFTQDQRLWLRMRARAGGDAWLLLKVADDWLLFDGEMAAHLVGRAGGTRAALLDNATVAWEGGLDEEELFKVIAAGPGILENGQ